MFEMRDQGKKIKGKKGWGEKEEKDKFLHWKALRRY